MKKIWTAGMAIILTMGLLAGCSGDNGNSQGTTGGSQGKTSSEGGGEGGAEQVTLKMPVLPDDLEAFKAAYTEFQKENPNIAIEFETYPQKQYYEKLRLQLSGGADYDLFAGNLDVMLDTGILEPLDGYLKDNNTDMSGYGVLLDSMKINGHTYGLPYRKSNWMLYYNKTLFDQYNVPYPSDDMTWEEFRELAKAMTHGSGADKVYGAYMQQWPQTWYMQAVQKGSTIIDKDLSEFKNALQLRMDMEQEGSIMSWSEQKSTGAHYNAAFQKGNVAMNLIGDWHVAQLRQAEDEGKIDFDWDVVPIPHPDGVSANTSLALPVTLMMNKNSKHKEEAFKAVAFMTGAQGAEVFASRGYLTGFTNDEIKKAYIGEGSRKPANLHYFLEQREYPEYPMLPGVKNIIVGQIYTQEGELALAGEQTAEQAIKRIEERIQAEWANKYGEDFQTK
ncbi:ABC transporter substrate-binding protein [Paenibacillus chungangensis]|uniref:ABC transporter substrate-binding protein n=1 Tax=Paenibacillus chungangensis TaxID=696535 RepID=A0ABW3HUI5_9BACL